MNSQYPIPNSAISFNPLNPNPNFSNPQFNSWPSQPSPQIPPQSHLQSPISDLPNSLSSLKTLIQSSNSTLQSLSSLIPPLSLSSNSLIQCPSNPNHWVPPNSLFLHSLHCPTSLDDVGTLLDSLQYPKTLKSEQHLIHQNKFVQPLNDPTSEVCFSLDDYVDFRSNFFYQGCPGVVSSLNDDATRRIFTLPSVLSFECANFVGSIDRESDECLGGSIKMLSSEMWVVRREFEQWSDYPNEYSYSVVRAMLCLECVKESDLLMWLVANSPRFGVVIDAAMRDHMSVLVRLCLKAMTREAARSYGSLFKSDVGDNGHKFNPKSLRFKCPVTVEVLRWLASQLSILYGEANAKSFVIAMLGHLLLSAASHASLFPLDRKMEHFSAIEQDKIKTVDRSGGITENEGNNRLDERIFCMSIFVYQIAAAIAALHERSLLEERIRAFRNPRPLTAYQRMAEHQYISQKANEERQKRPDYRPLIEHDSIPSQRQDDQQNMKMKTREELLAEERDYKRRRMSYRGKKLKRTAKEVMRDIIEEYMEAIKDTGGIGGLSKENEEGAMSTRKNSSAHNSTNYEKARHSTNDQQHDYGKSVDHNFEARDSKLIDASFNRREQRKKESLKHRHLEDKRVTKDRSSRDNSARSPSVDRRASRSREHRSHRRNLDVVEMDGDEHKDRSSRDNSARSPSVDRRASRSREHRSHRRNLDVLEMDGDEHTYNASRYNDHESLYSTSSTLRSTSSRNDKRKFEGSDRHRWRKHENDEWDSYRSGDFNDRYDPSEASDI